MRHNTWKMLLVAGALFGAAALAGCATTDESTDNDGVDTDLGPGTDAGDREQGEQGIDGPTDLDPGAGQQPGQVEQGETDVGPQG